MTVNIQLDDEERAEMKEILEAAFRDLRVEIRHTHVTEEREHFKHRENILRGVLDKLGIDVEHTA